MPLTVVKKEIEAERLAGYRYVQLLSRAEALVSGAGRDAIEPLLWDANANIIRSDVQNDRVVLDGTLQCQAVYRQGTETTLRALEAKSAISQAIDIPDVQPGMLSRVDALVEHVEVRYENGHMVFLVGLGIHIWVIAIEKIEGICEVEDAASVEKRFGQLDFVKLAAEASETAVMKADVELPQALDARNTLMDWGVALVDSVQPDLGGVRVKGRAMIETLVSSGIEGRPAVVVKYPIEFDKLIEVPEWMAENAEVRADLRSIRTQVENDDSSDEGRLAIQADVHFCISANLKESTKLLTDAYGLGKEDVIPQNEEINACCDVLISRSSETIRGTVMTEDGSPAIGSIIAVRAQPSIAEAAPDGDGRRMNGIIDVDVLYMPAGGDLPSTTHAELPFEMDMPQMLSDDSLVRMDIVSAEANALMSDRLEMKIGVQTYCETRKQMEYSIVKALETEEKERRKSAYIICWASEKDDAWTLGKRYGVPEKTVEKAAGEGGIAPGKSIVLNV